MNSTVRSKHASWNNKNRNLAAVFLMCALWFSIEIYTLKLCIENQSLSWPNQNSLSSHGKVWYQLTTSSNALFTCNTMLLSKLSCHTIQNWYFLSNCKERGWCVLPCSDYDDIATASPLPFGGLISPECFSCLSSLSIIQSYKL